MFGVRLGGFAALLAWSPGPLRRRCRVPRGRSARTRTCEARTFSKLLRAQFLDGTAHQTCCSPQSSARMKVVIKWGKETYNDVALDATKPVSAFRDELYKLTGE
jgi:hypothetical protein